MGLQTFDMAKMFGLQGKSYATMDVPDFIGSQLGWTITQFQDRFPNLHYILGTGLGWTDPEMLGLTYFTACFNEISFMESQGGVNPLAYTQGPILIPSGKWWYNSELRVGRSTVRGSGPFEYNGQGGTQIALTHTNWKSLYGAGQADTYMGFSPWVYPGEDGTSTLPVTYGTGGEWAHAFRIEDLCMTGTKGSGFNDPAIRECGVNMWWPGENSGAFNCLFSEFNDFGILISGAPAPARTRDCSFFWNGVAGTGLRGCAEADIELSHSGDYNPWAIYVFRQGEFNTSPNGVAFWPCFQDIGPGGTITLRSPKIEAFACNSSWPGMSACIPNIPGKGQMMARLTGRFHFTVTGGTSYVHSGQVNTLVQLVDDYYAGNGNLPMANSSVNIQGHSTTKYAYWLHDTYRGVKYVCNPIDNDLHGDSMYWNNLFPSLPTAYAFDPMTQVALTPVTCAYNGLQPFINATLGGAWNENLPPSFGYDTVTGIAF